MQKMDNQQLHVFNERQLQIFLTARLGDGCLCTTNSNSTYYSTNCKFEEYIDFKRDLLGDLFRKKSYLQRNGFSQTPIHILLSKSHKVLKEIKEMGLEDIIGNLDDLGIALWFYDDGSLHKDKLFYNLNTHKFSRETQKQLFIPFFNKRGIFPKIAVDRKKDGRVFHYLSIGKFDGAVKISQILEKYPLDCYSYKRWSSETIQKWSKLQEELKSKAIDVHILPKITLGRYGNGKISIEDIVRTYKKL